MPAIWMPILQLLEAFHAQMNAGEISSREITRKINAGRGGVEVNWDCVTQEL